MLNTVETYNNAAAGVIRFKTFVIIPDAMGLIDSITRYVWACFF